jgi:hypothetical protein
MQVTAGDREQRHADAAAFIAALDAIRVPADGPLHPTVPIAPRILEVTQPDAAPTAPRKEPAHSPVDEPRAPEVTAAAASAAESVESLQEGQVAAGAGSSLPEPPDTPSPAARVTVAEEDARLKGSTAPAVPARGGDSPVEDATDATAPIPALPVTAPLAASAATIPVAGPVPDARDDFAVDQTSTPEAAAESAQLFTPPNEGAGKRPVYLRVLLYVAPFVLLIGALCVYRFWLRDPYNYSYEHRAIGGVPELRAVKIIDVPTASRKEPPLIDRSGVWLAELSKGGVQLWGQRDSSQAHYPRSSPVADIAFSRDGMLAVLCENGDLSIQKVLSSQVTALKLEPYFKNLIFSPDGQTLLAYIFGTAILISRDGKTTQLPSTGTADLIPLNGRSVLMTTIFGDDTFKSRWTMSLDSLLFGPFAYPPTYYARRDVGESSDAYFRFLSPMGHKTLSLNPGGTRLLIGTHQNLLIVDPDTGKVLRKIEETPEMFVPWLRNDLVAVAHGGGSLHLWNAATGQFSYAVTGHEGNVVRLASTSNGNLLFLAGDDLTKLSLWRVTFTPCPAGQSSCASDPWP